MTPRVALSVASLSFLAYYLELNLHIKGDGENDDLD